jgi:DNA-binding GntR family transcriptional regulator
MEKSSVMGLKITSAPKSVKQMAYESLRAAIMDNTLRPGQELTEKSLAAEFGVSRTPIREAFLELARQGLVRLEPRRGACVAEISVRYVHEVYELREILERYAITRATQLMPDDALAAARADYDRAAAEVAQGHMESFMEFDRRFHNLLAQNCDNALVQESLMRVYDLAWRVRTHFVLNREHTTESCREHADILNAMEARDVQGAAEAIAVHDLHVRERVVKLLAIHYAPEPK